MKLNFVFFYYRAKKKKKLSILAFPQKCLEFKQNTCGVVNENKHASQSMSYRQMFLSAHLSEAVICLGVSDDGLNCYDGLVDPGL